MRQIITTRELAELIFAKQYTDVTNDISNWFYNNLQDVYESLYVAEIKHEYNDLTVYSTAYINLNSYAEAIDTIEPVIAQWIDKNRVQYNLEYSILCGTGVLPVSCEDTIALAFNSDIDVDVNILNRISFDLRIKEDMTKKSAALQHELDEVLLEHSQKNESDEIGEHKTAYEGDDVFFSQLDYLYEFYDATHKVFDFENFCYVVRYLSEQSTITEPFMKVFFTTKKCSK